MRHEKGGSYRPKACGEGAPSQSRASHSLADDAGLACLKENAANMDLGSRELELTA